MVYYIATSFVIQYRNKTEKIVFGTHNLSQLKSIEFWKQQNKFRSETNAGTNEDWKEE